MPPATAAGIVARAALGGFVAALGVDQDQLWAAGLLGACGGMLLWQEYDLLMKHFSGEGG